MNNKIPEPVPMWSKMCTRVANQGEFKMERISQNKFLFTYPRVLGVPINGRWTKYGRISELFMARKNKPLRVLEKKGNKRRFHSLPEDLLCFYCEFGLNSLKFLISGDCLLGKEGFVKFCNDFKPGYGFGKNPKDMQDGRQKRAKEILERRLFRNCNYCQHWNTDNVAQISNELDPNASEHIWDSDNNNFVNIYPQNEFCELGRKPSDGTAHCAQFQLTRDRGTRRSYKRRCKMARRYFAKLDWQEEHATGRTRAL